MTSALAARISSPSLRIHVDGWTCWSHAGGVSDIVSSRTFQAHCVIEVSWLVYYIVRSRRHP